ncbi:MAG: SDR family oxidoreductase [Proteobacteria bacterium]|nr:SDR family oxidoreductase [Pseudomonadota bacterium]
MSPDDAAPFADQVVLLTAATSGIGLAAAQQFAAGGARAVFINGRNAQAGERAAARVRALAGPAAEAPEVRFLPGDLTDPAAAEAVCRAALQAHGRIDVFVHACGAEVSPRPFVEIDPAHYRALIDGHFASLLHCMRVVAPAMVARNAGSIVVIASDAGKLATPGESIIGAMKAASVMFVRTLALELGRHRVRVNCVTPSLVLDTQAHDRVMASDFSRKIFEKATRRARLGLPAPADVARMAVFLAGPQAAYVTGQAVSVNGGISAA